MPITMNLNLPSGVDACREWLEKDLLNAEAARQLREGIAAEAQRDDPALTALWVVGAVLEGGALWNSVEAVDRTPQKFDRSLHESLVVHPREKLERRHKLASLFGRVLHLLEGDEVARTIARVTEKAAPQTFPQLCRVADECAQSLEMNTPEIRIARGEERLFTVMVDKSPFLCAHHDFVGEGNVVPPSRLSVKLGTKVLGWTRANRAVKKVGEWLPKKSRTQKVVHTVGELLPDVVHDWVRSWIQGVEFSADRAGLPLSGSIAASCQALLHLSPDDAPHISDVLQHGARWLLQEKADVDRATADRLRELLRFAVSEEYLMFIKRKEEEGRGENSPASFPFQQRGIT